MSSFEIEIGKLYEIISLSGFWLLNDTENDFNNQKRFVPKIGTMILCVGLDKEEGPLFYFDNNVYIVSVKLITNPNQFLKEIKSE